MNYQLAVPGSIDEVSELRVLAWHAAPGQAIEPGALLVELETHKVIVEIRAERPGFLRQVVCEEGGWQSVGKVLALLSDDPEDPLPEEPLALPHYGVEMAIV